MQTRFELLDVTTGGRLGHERRRPQRANRGRQQDVALRPTGVRVAGQRPGGDAPLEPLQRLDHRVWAKQRVGMIRAELLDRPQRLAHELGRIAEHIDRPGREVRRTDALGEHADARTALRQPRRRGQPGTPGADHDRVEVQLLSHVGRCSTSRIPWKIQSSSRAWRSWSPYSTGHTPFQRSSRKSRNDRSACPAVSPSSSCRMPVAR